MARKQNKTVVNLDDELNEEFAKYLKSKRDSNSSDKKRKNFGERLKEALEEQRRVQL
jgi:hypothetical protein